MAKTKKSSTVDTKSVIPQKLLPKISKRTTNLVERTIRCNGHLHKIILNSKGQLIMPNHTKDELEKFILMGDLGNNPCKCAVVLDSWRHGNYSDSQIHPLFAREKLVGSRLAERLARHQNKRRPWPNLSDIVYATKRIPRPDADKLGYFERQSESPKYIMAEYVTQTIYNTLLARGYSKEHISIQGSNSIYYHNKNEGSNPAYFSSDQVFDAQVTAHDCISCYINRTVVPLATLHGDTPDAEIPWRMLLDNAEKQLLKFMVVNAQSRQFAKQKSEFVSVATKAAKVMDNPSPEYCTIGFSDNSGTVTLTITHRELTISAATRIAKHYSNNKQIVHNLLSYSRKRLSKPWRYPYKPGRGMGARKKPTESTVITNIADEDSLE